MKKILTVIIVVLSVFLIYLGFRDKEIYYVSIGDGLASGINPYNQKDYGYGEYVEEYLDEIDKLEVYVEALTDKSNRITDILKDIKDNEKVNVDGKIKTFQNVLIKADLVTISIGTNDLLSNTSFNMDFSINDLYNKLENALTDFEELFKTLREYCKEKIVFIGFYNFTGNDELDEFFEYTNKKVQALANNYDIIYIDIFEDFKNSNYLENNSSYPNKEGYKVISDKIIKIIDEKMINN